QTHSDETELGIHRRGTGPGDRFSLPYFSVPDLSAALRRVEELGGSVIHPRPPWAICRDSEGTPSPSWRLSNGSRLSSSCGRPTTRVR
ncbi:MAG: VOC family protein, partial [Pseudonocardiaceae bacterium]